MKKIIASIALSTIILGGTSLVTKNVNAAEIGSGSTTGTVSFSESSSTTEPEKPVDPENPGGGEGGTTDPQFPGTPGPLSLDYAPTLDFGTHDISGKNEVYNAKALTYEIGGNSKIVDQFVQVTDKRAGDHKGWKVSVKQLGQFKDEKGNTLKGAKISFKNGKVDASEDVNVDGNKSVSTVDFEIDPEGSYSSVMTADTGNGFGTWITKWGEVKDDNTISNITLSVPGASVKNATTYNTTLTWSLSDTPSSPTA